MPFLEALQKVASTLESVHGNGGTGDETTGNVLASGT
jgi:hypothetical protein